MSWAFTEPGVYRLTLRAELAVSADSKPLPMGEQTFTFAVGIDPHTVPGMAGALVLRDGHTDVTADIDTGELYLYTDGHGGAEQVRHDPARTVIEVPAKALKEVPAGPGFRFLGRPGTQLYQLPQAVLGRHVHGEIDPHLWQDVANAKAYVQVIADALIELDPDGREEYEANRDAYLTELDDLDTEVAAAIATIPEADRQLITTHDAFGYLADAYGMQIAGFVVPNPAAEPSAKQVEALTETIADLQVQAVFVEPNLHARASVLRQVAEDQGVEVCTLHGDALPQDAPTYIDMMRQNASELSRCLGGEQ
jgi:anchored repeat ABC transporter substrate-binding protein